MRNKRPVTFLRYLLMILLCAVMLLPSPVQAEASESEAVSKQQETRTIRVGFPVQDGMSYLHKDGTPDGYSYVYMEKIAEYTGWKMEYIPYDSGDTNADISNAIADLEAGKIDLLGPILRNEDTENEMLFPENNYGTVYTTLCALETSNIREDNAAAKSPLLVGLWEQAKTRNAEVISFLDSQNVDYEIYYYQSVDAQYDALKKG